MIFTDYLGLDENDDKNDENDEEKASRSEEETAHWFVPPSSQLDCQVVQVGLQFPTRKDIV